MEKRITFIHTLNNFTGSPNVLSLVIKGFVDKGYTVDLITNKSYGFLSNLDKVNYHYTSYRWTNYKLITLLLLIWSQLEMFFLILIKFRKNKGLFYLNTILPFAAAWACWLTKKKRIYHVHENMWLKKPLYSIYRQTFFVCTQKTIFVSQYLKEVSKVKDSVVIYNSLSPKFILEKKKCYFAESYRETILMVSSLRKFKGIYEFIELSRSLPQYKFVLIVSATPKEVKDFVSQIENIPLNLQLLPKQENLHPYYKDAKVLMSLTHPDKWIETFGMTILEAMVYGIPAIVPEVGGPIELVEDGVNGFLVNPFKMSELKSRLSSLMEDDQLYSHFSNAASEKSLKFNYSSMISDIEQYLLKQPQAVLTRI